MFKILQIFFVNEYQFLPVVCFEFSAVGADDSLSVASKFMKLDVSALLLKGYSSEPKAVDIS